MIDCVFAPVVQLFPVALLEVRTTLPPGQKDKGPLALIVGVGIDEDTVTVIELEVAVAPDLVTFTA